MQVEVVDVGKVEEEEKVLQVDDGDEKGRC